MDFQHLILRFLGPLARLLAYCWKGTPRLRDHGGVSSLLVTKNTGSEKPGGLLSNTTVFVM